MLLCVFCSEMQVDAGVVALLQLHLGVDLIVVEVPVEIRQLFVVQFQRCHAVAEDHTPCRLKV